MADRAVSQAFPIAAINKARPPYDKCHTAAWGFYFIWDGLFEIFHAAFKQGLVLVARDVPGDVGAAALRVAHLAEDPAVGAGDALNSGNRAVDIDVDVHIGAALLVAVLEGDLAVLGQLGQDVYKRQADLKVPMDKQVILRHGTITSNAGFLGNPITYGVFGAEGLLYASIALIPVRIFLWSAGLSLYTKTDSKSVIKNLLTHPCVVSVFIGFGVMFAPFELPGFVTKTISSIGGCTTAISMMVIGAILADINLKSIPIKLLSYYSFIRLIFIPAVVFIVLSVFKVEPLLTGVCTLLSGMPAASMTAILAAKYNGNSEFGSQVVFVSTMLSMITIPLMTLFF